LIRSEVSSIGCRSRNYPCGGIHFKETETFTLFQLWKANQPVVYQNATFKENQTVNNFSLKLWYGGSTLVTLFYIPGVWKCTGME